jgi:hypothetical protein
MKVMSRSDGFKGYLLSKSVFALLHRELAEFVEDRGGGIAGGGGKDFECASITVEALRELLFPPSSSSSSASADLEYALSTVATYSDSSLTPLLPLFPAFIQKATAAVGTAFYDPTPAIVAAEALMARLNTAKATAAIEKTKSKWKGVVARRNSRGLSGKPPSEPEKKEESQADATLAEQLRDTQRLLQEQQEKEKLRRAAEKKALADLMASQDAASRDEAAHLAKVQGTKDDAREDATQKQLNMIMAMMADLKGVVVEQTTQLLDGQALIIKMSADTQELVQKSTSKVSSSDDDCATQPN